MQQIHGLVAGAVMIASACVPDDEPEFERTELELRSDGGGRTGGDWIVNGLSDPEVCGVDPAHSLDSPQGLGTHGWLGDDEPEAEEVIRYMVECALSEGDSVTVDDDKVSFTFEGMLGLAPEWKAGPCDEDCQQWVSACLLARTNETGGPVRLFVQGAHPALGFGVDPEFPHYEGTFFGNVFSSPASLHACPGTPAGVEAAAQQGRICTQDPEACGFTIHDHCVHQARCGSAPSGVATILCAPDPAGPSYHGISVHVPSP